MTKKHYIAIAAAIVDAIQEHRHPDMPGVPLLDGELLVNSLCGIFKADNPAFDRSRFEDACGIVATSRVRS